MHEIALTVQTVGPNKESVANEFMQLSVCVCLCCIAVFDETGNFLMFASMVGIKGQSVCGWRF